MDPFSIALGGITICQVAGQIIQLGIAYGQSVKSLPEEVQALVSEISLLSGVLNSLCAHLGKDAGGSVNVELLAGPIQECEQQLEELHQFLLKQQSGSRLRRLGRSLKWPMKEQETRDWIVRMERYKNTFSLALEQEKLKVEKKMSADVHDMKLAQESDAVRKRREKQKETFRSALKWVSPADPQENHLANRNLQQAGTGQWLLRSEEFDQWKHTKGSFLWLYGGAGSGKTILSSIILDHLIQEQNPGQQGGPKNNTMFFYCDFRDNHKVNAAGIYGSLIAQLLEAHWVDHLPDYFELFYKKNNAKPPNPDFLKAQLFKLIKEVGHTRILVDALDECTDTARIPVLETLLEVQQTGRVSLLITSREEVDIKAVLSGSPSLCVNALVNSQDIKLFVTEECERNVKLQRKLKGSTKAEVISTISDKADGMFRWAKCALDDIARLRNDKAIKQALTKLPKDLTETYERIIESISEDDKELALRILRWLSCSLRPLRVQELIEGIALEIEDTILDPETFLNDPEDIVDICGSLVALDIHMDTVALAHFSVKEFFIAPARKDGTHPEFFIDPRETNFELAKLCVTYLCLGHFGGGRCTSAAELRKRRDSYALYNYAVLLWPGHARSHVNVEDEDFISIVGKLFADPDKDGNYNSWRQAYETFKRGMGHFGETLNFDDKDSDCSRLLYACRLGLYSLAKHLINQGMGHKAIHSQEFASDPAANKSGNALNAACESGDAAVAELILSAGADVNAMAGVHGLALIIAVNTCHYRDGPPDYRLVEVLIEKGANVNLITPEKDWPLRNAAGIRDVHCIKLFLDAGAELGWRNDGTSVMEMASIDGSSQAARERFELLRKNGGSRFIHPELGEIMDIGLMTGADGYGLFLAATSNFFESAQKILEKDGETLFSEPAFAMLVEHIFKECATNGFYKFLEQMLVYSGGAFAKYSDCVKIAASQGHAKTLGVLLDIDGPSLEAGLLEDLMVLAAGRGHQDVVNELTKRGVPPLCTNKHGWSTMLVTTLSVADKDKIDSTLDVFRRVGHGIGSLDSMVKKPSGWVLRPCHHDPAEPSLVFEGTSAFLPPGQASCWITFDHPIPPSASYFYYEITIEEMVTPKMSFGIASALTEHDRLGPYGIMYTSDGTINDPTNRNCRKGFPVFSKGTVLGCAVDIKNQIAVFTVDGTIIEASCREVKGMVNGIVELFPGDRIRANFGESPFRCETAAFEGGLSAFAAMQPTFKFRTSEFVDPLEPFIGGPDPRFIG